jgi:hypothetical protein
VLDGSVRRAGDEVRITVRLSDVANGYQIWSEHYDRGIRDIFNVQDEIAKTIAIRDCGAHHRCLTPSSEPQAILSNISVGGKRTRGSLMRGLTK